MLRGILSGVAFAMIDATLERIICGPRRGEVESI